MSMVRSRHSPIISWSKQSANFQSFTETKERELVSKNEKIRLKCGINTASKEYNMIVK